MAHGDGDDSVGSEMDRRAEWRRRADAAVAVEPSLDEDRSEQNGNGGRGQDVIEADPRPPAEPSAPGPGLGRVVSVEEGDGGAGRVARRGHGEAVQDVARDVTRDRLEIDVRDEKLPERRRIEEVVRARGRLQQASQREIA